LLWELSDMSGRISFSWTKLQRATSRPVLGQILLLAAAFAIIGALILQAFGVGSAQRMGPVAFVTSLVSLKLALFAFWPQVRQRGLAAQAVLRDIFRDDDPLAALAEEKSTFELNASKRRPSGVALWDQHDPRLNVALFSASVPTFVLSSEQRFLDWNPAFEVAFGDVPAVKRGGHVSAWYGVLDNFRRVPKRTGKLYGEGILPITDRERVAWNSPVWGRMVFTRIMAPIVDQFTGRIIGWTVVLNINSVAKRQEFFEAFYRRIDHETRRIRRAAAIDGLFKAYSGWQDLTKRAVELVGESRRVLDVGCGTGESMAALLAAGARVTAVDNDVHALRRAKTKIEGFESRARIVRQDPSELRGLPEGRFDAAVLLGNAHRFANLAAVLASVHSTLKAGGMVVVGGLTEGSEPTLAEAAVDPFFNGLRASLEAAGAYDELKHQFNHVLESEREATVSQGYVLRGVPEIRAAAEAAGFAVEASESGHCDGHAVLVVLRRR
jgi:SAM-dependent methyltransferase/PAS domain-containing protein